LQLQPSRATLRRRIDAFKYAHVSLKRDAAECAPFHQVDRVRQLARSEIESAKQKAQRSLISLAGVQQTKAISPSQAAAAIEHQRDGSCAALFLLSLSRSLMRFASDSPTCAKNAQNDKTAAATTEMRL